MSALKELQEKGLITVRKGQGNSSLYSTCNLNDRLVRNTDYSEKQTTGSLENRPESSGIQTTITINNKKGNSIIEREPVYNTPVREQVLDTIKALHPGFSEQEMGKCADKWLDTCRANGWVDRNGRSIRDWQAHLRNYVRSWASNNAKATTRAAALRNSSLSSCNALVAHEYR